MERRTLWFQISLSGKLCISDTRYFVLAFPFRPQNPGAADLVDIPDAAFLLRISGRIQQLHPVHICDISAAAGRGRDESRVEDCLERPGQGFPGCFEFVLIMQIQYLFPIFSTVES